MHNQYVVRMKKPDCIITRLLHPAHQFSYWINALLNLTVWSKQSGLVIFGYKNEFLQKN